MEKENKLQNLQLTLKIFKILEEISRWLKVIPVIMKKLSKKESFSLKENKKFLILILKKILHMRKKIKFIKKNIKVSKNLILTWILQNLQKIVNINKKLMIFQTIHKRTYILKSLILPKNMLKKQRKKKWMKVLDHRMLNKNKKMRSYSLEILIKNL